MSKRLKEENDTLRQENESLRVHVAQLEAQLVAIKQHTGDIIPELELSTIDKRTSRSCTDAGKRSREAPDLCARKNIKRPKHGNAQDMVVEEPRQAHSTTPSSPYETSHGILTPDVLADLAAMDVDPTPPPKTSARQDNQQQPEFRSCGMCSNPSNCLCQEYGLPPFNPPPTSHGALDIQLTSSAALLDAAANASAQAVSFPRVSSMVGNPPPIAPAVPLPKRPRKGGTQNVFLAVFAKSSTAASTSTTDVIMTAEEATPRRAGCSGDPANCAACADSAFGKAFCNALRNSVCTLNPCPSCPAPSHDNRNSSPIDLQTEPRPTTIPTSINPSNLNCCGDPNKCGGSSCSTVKTPPLHAHGLRPDPMVIAEAARRENSQALMHCGTCPPSIPTLPPHGQREGGEDEEELPTEEAWRRIEAHPKAHLALEDQTRLHQLAEIMLDGARSLVSSGPRLVSAAPSGSGQAKIQVEYEHTSESGSGGRNGDEEGKPRLVPEDELIQCQRQRRGITTLPKRNVSEGWNWLDHFDREFGRG